MRILFSGAAALAAIGTLGTASAEPKLIDAVSPEYPRAAERRAIEGEVMVSFDVAADGTTTNVSVVSAQPAGIFDSSAVNAVERWRFSAGEATTGIQKRLVFKLEG